MFFQPVEGGIEPAHQPVAAKHRQHVVPPLPLGLRHVDLDPVEHAEEPFQAIRIAHEIVERRERNRAPAKRSVKEVAVCDEPPVDAVDLHGHHGPGAKRLGDRAIAPRELAVEQPPDALEAPNPRVRRSWSTTSAAIWDLERAGAFGSERDAISQMRCWPSRPAIMTFP